MKKQFKAIVLTVTLLFSIFLLGACGNQAKETEKKSPADSKITATVVLQEEGKEINKKEVKVKKDTTLYKTMDDNFDLEAKDGFITSIDGKKQDEKAQKYWTFTINDKQINKGAKDVKVKDKDKVIFNLAPMK